MNSVRGLDLANMGLGLGGPLGTPVYESLNIMETMLPVPTPLREEEVPGIALAGLTLHKRRSGLGSDTSRPRLAHRGEALRAGSCRPCPAGTAGWTRKGNSRPTRSRPDLCSAVRLLRPPRRDRPSRADRSRATDGQRWTALSFSGDVPDAQATQATLLPGGVLLSNGVTTWFGQAEGR